MRYLTVTPAYGRDYKTAKAAKADWEAGKDFLIQDLRASGYINKEQQEPDMTINIRYNGNTMVAVVRPAKR